MKKNYLNCQNYTLLFQETREGITVAVIPIYNLFQEKMSKFFIVLLSLAVICQAAKKNSESSESSEEHEGHEGHTGEDGMCMTHCSYVCMTNGGKAETCANLLGHNNTTLASLPAMASCPTSTAMMNDCYLKCGCQCTRCAVCLVKSFNLTSAKAACKAGPNVEQCIKDKKNAALKACN